MFHSQIWADCVAFNVRRTIVDIVLDQSHALCDRSYSQDPRQKERYVIGWSDDGSATWVKHWQSHSLRGKFYIIVIVKSKRQRKDRQGRVFHSTKETNGYIIVIVRFREHCVKNRDAMIMNG